MKCPVCGLPLIVVERLKIELDYCVGCKGFWFDAGELEHLAEAMDLKTDFQDPLTLPAVSSQEEKRPCPRCAKKMEKIQIGQSPPVLVDRCPQKHGLWFDAGELGQVLDQTTFNEGEHPDPLFSFLGEVFTPHDKANKDADET